jgi:hypothetical protein
MTRSRRPIKSFDAQPAGSGFLGCNDHTGCAVSNATFDWMKTTQSGP